MGVAVAIGGVRLLDLPVHADGRGRLVALDSGQNLPFPVKRIFYIFDCASTAVRAEHANSYHVALTALRGEVTLDLENGQEMMTVRLSRPDQALCIHAGVWLRMHTFTPDTIVLAAASETYEKSHYFDAPQPKLLADLSPEGW